jgi:hypothetical protein
MTADWYAATLAGHYGVGVDAQRHRGVRVAEPAGDGAHVVATRDRGGGGPLAEIVQAPLLVDPGELARTRPPPANAVEIRGIGGVGEHVRRYDLATGSQLHDVIDRLVVECGRASIRSGMVRPKSASADDPTISECAGQRCCGR